MIRKKIELGNIQNELKVKITPLREKCPNTELFLVHIFPHSDLTRRDKTQNRNNRF